MRFITSIIFFSLFSAALSQDKIYLQNGECLTGLVKEINPDLINYTAYGEKYVISTAKVLLIEFRNGIIEVFTPPRENCVYTPDGIDNTRHIKQQQKLSKDNLISFNSMALCNSDIAVFYERFLLKKRIGLGGMAAYNFNTYAGLFNNYISTLHAGKKKYDLGLTANIYLGDLSLEKAYYFGILFKYTELSFLRTVESPISINGNTSVNVNYLPANGKQLSTLLVFGSTRPITEHLHIKTLYGIGGFNMRGFYKDEYNYQEKNRRSARPNTDYTFRPKLYFGFNLGYIF